MALRGVGAHGDTGRRQGLSSAGWKPLAEVTSSLSPRKDRGLGSPPPPEWLPRLRCTRQGREVPHLVSSFATRRPGLRATQATCDRGDRTQAQALHRSRSWPAQLSFCEATGRLDGCTTLFPRPCPHCRPAGRGGPRVPHLPSFLLPGRPKAATRLCRHLPIRAQRGSRTQGGRTQRPAGAAEGEEGQGPPARGPWGAWEATAPPRRGGRARPTRSCAHR